MHIRNKRIELILALAAALAGCAAPVADESVESQAENLNGAPDFQLGIMAVKYVNGQARKGPIKWTQPIAQAAASGATSVFTGWTYMPDGQVPDGIRVALSRTGDPTFALIAADLRFTIVARDDMGVRTTPGVVRATPWISEAAKYTDGMMFSPTGATDGVDYQEPKAYAIGVDIAPWPANVPQSLVDFRVGATGCGTNSVFGRFFLCRQGNRVTQFTDWATNLPNGGISWSHTADGAGDELDGEILNIQARLQ